MKETILLGHVLFGVGCVISTVWVFVEALNARESNLSRIKWMSRAAALFMWLAFIAGGYWCVADYKADKALILNGPWPFAHGYFMETKEHFVITLLLLVTYLPIAASNNLALDKGARRLVLCVATMVAVLSLMAEGHGAMIAMGVKKALLANPHLYKVQMNIPRYSRYTVSFGWSLALCAVLNALLVIAKEKSSAVAGWMQKITGHHWITHAVIVFAVFVLFGWLLAGTNAGQGPKTLASALTIVIVAGVTAGVAVVLGFYLMAD